MLRRCRRTRYKDPLRLAEHLDESGAVTVEGVAALTRFVAEALEVAEDKGCEEILGFATSAVRDAVNTDDVLRRVREETGVDIGVLPGEDEARLTFLAVRRWFGWSSGRLAVFDIGGGSLEIATGADEAPDVAHSLPLGAGRLTREWLPDEQPDDRTIAKLRKKIRADIARDAGSRAARRPARPCGGHVEDVPLAGPGVRRGAVGRGPPGTTGAAGTSCSRSRCRGWRACPPTQKAELPGVSASRAHQLLAGALVADAVMDIFELTELEICPWALREGIILERLDQISILG